MKCGHVDSLGRTCGLPRDAPDHAGIAAVGGHSHLYKLAPPVDDEVACREIAYNYGMDDVCIHTAVDLLDVIREAYAAGRAAGAEQLARDVAEVLDSDFDPADPAALQWRIRRVLAARKGT